MLSGKDVTSNLEFARESLSQAAEQGASLALLPENFALMTANESAKQAFAEPLGDGPIQAQLAEWAVEFAMAVVAGSLPITPAPSQAEADRVFTSSCVFDKDGSMIAHYHKMHLFDVSFARDATDRETAGQNTVESYRESATYLAGEGVTAPVATEVGQLGLSICYDLRFPEFYRRLRQQGAELITVPAAFTATTGKAHWEPLLRARAIENQCYVIAANQCGINRGAKGLWGHSMIIDPWGRVLAEQQCDEPGVVIAEVDLTAQAQLRRDMPVMQHARLL